MQIIWSCVNYYICIIKLYQSKILCTQVNFWSSREICGKCMENQLNLTEVLQSGPWRITCCSKNRAGFIWRQRWLGQRSWGIAWKQKPIHTEQFHLLSIIAFNSCPILVNSPQELLNQYGTSLGLYVKTSHFNVFLSQNSLENEYWL